MVLEISSTGRPRLACIKRALYAIVQDVRDFDSSGTRLTEGATISKMRVTSASAFLGFVAVRPPLVDGEAQ